MNRVPSRTPGFDPALLPELRRTSLAEIASQHREMVEAIRRRVADDRVDVTRFNSGI